MTRVVSLPLENSDISRKSLKSVTVSLICHCIRYYFIIRYANWEFRCHVKCHSKQYACYCVTVTAMDCNYSRVMSHFTYKITSKITRVINRIVHFPSQGHQGLEGSVLKRSLSKVPLRLPAPPRRLFVQLQLPVRRGGFVRRGRPADKGMVARWL